MSLSYSAKSMSRPAALLLALLASVAAAKMHKVSNSVTEGDDSVVDLSRSNFDAEFRAGLPHAYVVEFYNPSCAPRFRPVLNR